MKDQYGRVIEYLRVSVTDRCNLRCIYCMPEEGISMLSHSDILRFDELVRICRICASQGITRIKLTGGEPLVRRGIDSLVGEIKQIPGIEEVTLTTNGTLLRQHIRELVCAGLDGVNISIDTLDEGQFRRITRGGELREVLEGIQAAIGFCGERFRVHLNCAAIKGWNEDQYAPLALYAKKYPVDVRFIEMMPVGLGKEYSGDSQQEILNVLEETFGPGRKVEERRGNGPAVYYSFEGFQGRIGFISAVTHQFCGGCNRVRLTSQGFLKACLQYHDGGDLREMLREKNSTDEEISAVIRQIIYRKPRCHQFCGGGEETGQKALEEKDMWQIGG